MFATIFASGFHLRCGFTEDWESHQVSGDVADNLPGLRDLTAADFPASDAVQVQAGTGFVSTGIQIQRGWPVVAHARSVDGVSAWGEPGRVAGFGAPAPLRAHRAILLRIGDRVIELGSNAVFRAPQDGIIELAVNAQDSTSYAVDLSWGEPSVAYNPQLDHLGLDAGSRDFATRLARLEDGPSTLSVETSAGARVRLRSFWVSPSGVRNRPESDAGIPFAKLLPQESVTEALPFFGYPEGAIVAVTPDLGIVSALPSAVWTIASEGKLSVQLNGAPRGWGREVEYSVHPPIGTRIELLPWEAFDEVEQVALRELPRKFVEAKFELEAGDLLRIDVRGFNDLPSDDADLEGLRPYGTLETTVSAGPNGERGWLVAGGRKRAIYARIGDTLVELIGNDAFYAPESGSLELGVNQCFDGGDWPTYEACRAELEDLDLDLVVTIGRVRSRVTDED